MTPEQTKLVEDNLGLVGAVIHKRFWGLCLAHGYDEVLQVGRLGLIQAAQRYDAGKGGFASFAARTIWGAVMNRYSDSRRGPSGHDAEYRSALRLDAPVKPDGSACLRDMLVGGAFPEDAIIAQLDLSRALDAIGQGARKLLVQRYVLDIGERTLAQMYGCSRTTIYNRLEAARREARRHMEVKGARRA